MPQSLAQVYLHLVFSTKSRIPFLRDPTERTEMFLYLKGTCDGLNCASVQVGGWEDHVHILCRFGRTITIADVVKGLKTASSNWIKQTFPRQRDFHWQLGYGAFSVSQSQVADVVRYIQNQEVHHASQSYQDEFRRLCALYGLEIDERYVWD